ncbi:MAG: hypothetical protein ACXV4B_08025 [Halobacteriota archaeon]
MAHRVDASLNGDRLKLEPMPNDAMRYVCPMCLEEGFKPSVIQHRPDCAYLKRQGSVNDSADRKRRRKDAREYDEYMPSLWQ